MHKKNISRQLKLLLNYVLGPLLFLILVYVMYVKIKTQPDLPEKIALLKNVFSKQNIWQVAVLILLLFANWGIEARKWQLLMRPVENVSCLYFCRTALENIPAGHYI
jgi:uncharacterized membrane protein YbhN (UPF0104 family)